VITRDEARARSSRPWARRYKLEILDGIPAGEDISFYQHGSWIDLCEGPHVPSTRFLGAVKLTSVAGAYWRGDERNPMLQRIYGTAFPTQKALDAHLRSSKRPRRATTASSGKELSCSCSTSGRRRRPSSCRAARSSTTRSSRTCATSTRSGDTPR
jgi:threonyl-tRNA synthetase